jgi:hypothetical protein
MTVKRVPLLTTVLLVSGAAVAPSSTNAATPFGFLVVEKDCSKYSGQAGSFCTVTSANIPEIAGGAKIFYGQPINVPEGLLDSNVVLDAGEGNRAVGRCTLDLSTGLGLCTFSDGTGRLAGFNARVDVSALSDGVSWQWAGTYAFENLWPGARGAR